MQATRRRMMMAMTGAVAAALTERTMVGQRAAPQPMPSPNAPNQNVPAGLDGADIPVRNGGRPIAPVTWMAIRSDSQKLLAMANDFNSQVGRTNLSATLPLSLIQEMHKIEKLAKQIQDRMKR